MFRRIPGFFFVIAALVLGFWAGPALAAPAKPNIVLITLESMRADWMGFLGSKARLTPNLDAIAAQSMIFEQAYAQAPLTVTSHATILSGTYPQTHQVSELGSPLAASLPFLPDLLHARGYRTAAFIGSFLLDSKNAPGFYRGFDSYDAGFQPPQPGKGRFQTVLRRPGDVVARAVSWLSKGANTPFFLWVYLPDPGASYNADLSAADAAVGKLVAALRAQKLYDDVLIVMVADHGESLGAHGEDGLGIFLYDETIHVPLLLKLPKNQDAGKRVRVRTRLVDVAPTILEVAGVPVPSQMQGQSLLRTAKSTAEQPVYSRSDFPQAAFGWSALESWRAGKYLYIRAPKPELYDLAADPGATRNLAQSSKATLDTMASQLAAFDQRFTAQGNSAGQLSSSEMQKLASLGYVGMVKVAVGKTEASGTEPKDQIGNANKVLAAQDLLEDGKPEKAWAALQPVMPGLAGSYLAQYTAGLALAQQQQYVNAVPYLHKAIELQPNSAWAQYQMGACLLQTGDYKTAAVHLEIAAGRLQNFADSHLLLAQAYDHLGRGDDAKRERLAAARVTGTKN